MKIIIIGGGASGMMAAITASRQGKANEIIILEHSDRVGKKILSTGNGKCNLTNKNMNKDYFYTEDPSYVEQVLSMFSEEDTLAFFADLGLCFKERDGYVYPRSGQAATVLDALRNACAAYGVKIITMAKTREIHVEKNQSFRVEYEVEGKKQTICGERLILATGSQASNLPSADESGLKLVKKLGYKITPVLPALTGLKSSYKGCKTISGVRQDGKVELYVDGALVAEDTGEIQQTEYGISGIPVFQVSRFASRALHEGKKVVAQVDYLPEFDSHEIDAFAKRQKNSGIKRSTEEILGGLVNKKMAALVARECDDSLEKALSKLKCFTYIIQGTNTFAQAQVCTGGVALSQVKINMESKLHKNLFFAGELLDVDAICGGYNLQWAWATGFLAGKAAAN